MYWVESVGKVIYAFDYDASSGSTSNKRTFYHHKGVGLPDGMAVDIEGNIWLALYGGGAVLRISSETGSVIGEIRLPVSIVTCPCFGGPEMDELFITTGISPQGEGSDREGLDGAVYRVKVGVKGLPKHKFRLTKLQQ
jgi:sugar lactone lactonase YvrE